MSLKSVVCFSIALTTGVTSVAEPPPPTGLLLIALTTSFSLFAVELVFASTAPLTALVAAVV